MVVSREFITGKKKCHKLKNRELKFKNLPAPGCLKVDTHWINHYPVDNAILVFIILIHWIVIHQVDSAMEILNNRARSLQKHVSAFGDTCCYLGKPHP